MRNSLILICSALLATPTLAQAPAAPPETQQVLRTKWSLDKQNAAKGKAPQRRTATAANARPAPRARSNQSPRITAKASNKGRGSRGSVGVAVPF
jgi:hypothetical protein